MVALRGAGDGLIIGGLILDAESKADVIASSQLFDALALAVEEHAEDALEFITA
jgi:hypothetical protein